MLKREGKQVSFQSLIFGILVIVLTILSSGASIITHAHIGMMEMFFFIYHLALVIFSLLIGLSAFSNDRKEGGMEYVLTLPYTRLQVLSMKVIPRLLSMVGLYLFYIVLMALFGMSPDKVLTLPVLPHSYLAIICFSLFVIGIQFSVFQGSIIVASCGAIIAFLVFFILSFIIPTVMLTFLPQFSGFNIFLTSNFWGIVRFNFIMPIMWWLASSVAFAYAFKSFDLKPKRNFFRRYLKVFIPGAIAVLIASFGFVYLGTEKEIPRSHYYLTQSHYLIETNFWSLKIHDGKSVKELDGTFFPYGIVEHENYIYLELRDKVTKEYNIVRINLTNPIVEPVYHSDYQILSRNELYLYKDIFAVFENNKRDKMNYFTLVHSQGGMIKRIPLPVDYPSYSLLIIPKVFGVQEIAGKKFWLVYTGTQKWGECLRISEEGKIENLGRTEVMPYYGNGMLVTLNNGNLEIKRISETGTEVLKTIPVEKDFRIIHFSINGNFDTKSPREIYAGIYDMANYKWAKVFRLDLNSLELMEVKSLNVSSSSLAIGRFFYQPEDTTGNWYYVDMYSDDKEKTQSVKLYKMKQGVPELFKQFELLDKSDFFPFFNVFPGGIVIQKKQEVHVYAFPDFKELNIKS